MAAGSALFSSIGRSMYTADALFTPPLMSPVSNNDKPKQCHTGRASAPFLYSEEITQDVATGLSVQFGLAQEMKVVLPLVKIPEDTEPADVVIGFYQTVIPVRHTSLDGVLNGMSKLRKEVNEKNKKLNSSAVGAFQFLNKGSTQKT